MTFIEVFIIISKKFEDLMNNITVLLTTETTPSNFFELAGNFLLKPTRKLWNGSKICFVRMKDTSLEMHVRTTGKLDDKCGISRYKFLNAIVIIITIVPGVIFKGLAFLSSKTRENHQKIISSLEADKHVPKGINILGVQSYVDSEAGQIEIDLRDYSKEEFEKIILDRLSTLGPSVLWHNRLVYILTNEPNLPEINLDYSRDDGVRIIDLFFQNFLLPAFRFSVNKNGRVFDYFSPHGCYYHSLIDARNGQEFYRP